MSHIQLIEEQEICKSSIEIAKPMFTLFHFNILMATDKPLNKPKMYSSGLTILVTICL